MPELKRPTISVEQWFDILNGEATADWLTPAFLDLPDLANAYVALVGEDEAPRALADSLDQVFGCRWETEASKYRKMREWLYLYGYGPSAEPETVLSQLHLEVHQLRGEARARQVCGECDDA